MSSNKPTILFNACKKEKFTLKEGFIELHKKLKPNFNVESNEDGISLDKLKTASLVIFAGPQEKFTTTEVIESLITLICCC
jgi:intraflagellar transport protein 52